MSWEAEERKSLLCHDRNFSNTGLAAMWKIEGVLNQLDDLAKEISEKTLKVPYGFFPLSMIK